MATKKKSTTAATSKTSKAADPTAPPRKRRAKDPLDEVTLAAIKKTAAGIHDAILQHKRPELRTPVRALSNVSYDPKKGYLEIGTDKKVRTLSVSSVKTFAQTLKMMALSQELIKNDDVATKRDAYYQSTPSWTISRPCFRISACLASSCALSPTNTVAPSPANSSSSTATSKPASSSRSTAPALARAPMRCRRGSST